MNLYRHIMITLDLSELDDTLLKYTRFFSNKMDTEMITAAHILAMNKSMKTKAEITCFFLYNRPNMSSFNLMRSPKQFKKIQRSFLLFFDKNQLFLVTIVTMFMSSFIEL